MNQPAILSATLWPLYPEQQAVDEPTPNLGSRQSYRPIQLPHRPAELPAGYNPTPLPPRPSAARMSYAMHSDEELAQLQKLSNEFQPEVTGPLVGPRLSTAAITTEYANGDPVYRAKTQNLPYRYAQYRTCRGDGHCGWRAIAFGYFECLQRVGDRHKFFEEQTRLGSLGNLLNQVGFTQDVIEDFADETFTLLRKLVGIPSADQSQLLSTFNDDLISQAIITHMKLLTSAWIQTHPADFAPFLPDQDIRRYCSTSIETAVCEIEHVGVNALFNVLLKPAGFALEILYLDRSAGEEGNSIRYDVTGPDGLLAIHPPTIRLLYRPGHYDLLYKAEEIQQMMASPAPGSTNVSVNLAPLLNEDYVHMDRGFSDVLAYIPGMSAPSFAPTLGQSSYLSDPFGYSSAPAPYPQPAPQTVYSPISASHAPPDYALPNGMPLETPANLLPSFGSVQRAFRPSAYELKPEFTPGQTHPAPFQTSIFKNSHYNTAHFLNPDFQPEEWTPGPEYVNTTNRPRHKSTS